MTLRLYDTATRGVRDFAPLEEGKVSIYYCGATVQAASLTLTRLKLPGERTITCERWSIWTRPT